MRTGCSRARFQTRNFTPARQKEPSSQQHEKQRWFQQGRLWRAGVEGCISVLKRRQELDRCRDHEVQGFDMWVGWGVIAGNLLVIGRKVAVIA
jgi:hypothetical protein